MYTMAYDITIGNYKLGMLMVYHVYFINMIYTV